MKNCCRSGYVLVLSATLVVACLAIYPASARQEQETVKKGAAHSATATTSRFDDKKQRPKNNLIRNGGFQKIKDEMPVGWVKNTWSGKGDLSVDTEEGHADKPCVKISSSEGGDVSWSYRVNLKPRTDYRLSAWIKTRSFDKGSGKGASLNLHELQFEGASKAITADSDWTKITTEFNSGDRRAVLVNMLYGGWGQSKGEAWFDDVELIELGSKVPTMTEQEAYTYFESSVLPVLQDNCWECHGDDPEDLKGNLALTSHKLILRGGDSGPAVDVKFPKQSLLLDAINYHNTYEMPPSGQLPKEQIQTLTTWVQMGMPWKPGTEIEIEVGDHKQQVPEVNEETKKWWSFQRVTAVEPPAVKNADWVYNPIDAFILAGLEARDFEPAPDASRQSLIRRAYYDLMGLPPTTAEVAKFVADDSPDAYERLIDRLLDSPQYGEKWGRHWLDLVRYAESNSFERDGTKPFVWRYRDYIIRSFNDDKPYDQFLKEQLAGDELETVTPDSIIATGYYRLGAWDDEPVDAKQAQFDDLDDIMATTCQTMIGLTVNCARCHDHKIDPVPQKDYYQMLSFFTNIRRYGIRAHPTVLDASVKKIGDGSDKETIGLHKKKIVDCKKQLGKIEDLVKQNFIPVEHEEFQYPFNRVPLVAKRVGKQITQEQLDEYRKLTATLRNLQNNLPTGDASALCVKEHGDSAPDSFVLIRGNVHVQGEPVEPGFLSILSPPEPVIKKPANGESSGRRLAFANWIIDPNNPMTGRVIVNRLWQFHFGRGIVRTTSDFGFQGAKPTHPELLDWLAAEFVRGGWKIKRFHKLIMMSHAYRMSSRFNPDAYKTDPANDCFWRFDPRRLSAEEIRDSILTVTGNLNIDKMYGPSIFVKLPKEVLAGQSRPGDGWGNSSIEDQNRRSVYIHVKRSLKVPILSNFDAADTDFTCPVRFNTTQPTQALGMLNSDFTNDQAMKFATLVNQLCPDSVDDQVKLILSRTLQREPTVKEIKRGVKLIADWQSNDGVDEKTSLKYFCLLALNLNEFIYLD